MKAMVLKGFVATGWAGVFFLAGAVTAFESARYLTTFNKMETVIRELEQRRAYVCEYKGSRLECQSWILKDPGV